MTQPQIYKYRVPIIIPICPSQLEPGSGLGFFLTQYPPIAALQLMKHKQPRPR